MGSPHTFGYHHLAFCLAGGAKIADPGTGNTIPLRKSLGICPITIAAASETRALPSATGSSIGVGTRIIVVADEITNSGTCTVNGVLFDTEGQWAEFICVQYNSLRAWVASPGGLLAATGAELNRAADVSTRLVTSSATLAVTEALHEGRTILMSGSGSSKTYTLPAATGSGGKYRFVVATVNTSNHVIAVSDSGTESFLGNIISNSTAPTPDLASIWPGGAGIVSITLNGTTKGGSAIGDWIEVQDAFAASWVVTGVTTSTTAATPFA